MPNIKRRPTSVGIVQEDNNRVKVTEHRFVPGAETKPHVHQWDYVVVPQTDGDLLLITPEGVETKAHLVKGVSYYRQAGVNHNVINVGSEELVFTEVELKAHPIVSN